MSLKKILTIISIVFISVGIILAVIPTDWNNCYEVITFIVTIFGYFLAIVSLIMPKSYKKIIYPTDWIKNNEDQYYFVVTEKRHGMGKNPKTTIYAQDEKENYEEILTYNSYNENGDVTIIVNRLQTQNFKVVIS